MVSLIPESGLQKMIPAENKKLLPQLFEMLLLRHHGGMCEASSHKLKENIRIEGLPQYDSFNCFILWQYCKVTCDMNGCKYE